jgi:hypothetical protein
LSFARYSSLISRNLLYSNYNSGRSVSQNGSSFPYCSHDIANYATAAPASLIVAAFMPQWWLLPCFPPRSVAQKSQFGGASPVCRRSLRRQFRHNWQLLAHNNIRIES